MCTPGVSLLVIFTVSRVSSCIPVLNFLAWAENAGAGSPPPAGVPLRAGDLEPLRALQPHAPADGEEGVGLVEPGEDVHGDRPFGHRGRRVGVVEPADLRLVLLDAVPRALLDREKADIAGPHDRRRVLARRSAQR